MTDFTSEEDRPLWLQLQLEDLRVRADGRNARVRDKLSYARAIAKIDPDRARRRLEKLHSAVPQHAGTLVSLFDLSLEHGGPQDVAKWGNLVRPHAKDLPIWVRRYFSLVDTGRVRYDSFEIAVDVETTHPLILRHLAKGSYETKEVSIARQILRAGDRVIELGAGIGFVSVVCNRAIPGLVWQAVEVNPDLVASIEQNRKLNGLNFEIVNCAYAKGDGTRKLYVDRSLWWASSLLRTEDTGEVIEAAARDINSALAEFEPNVLIVDIEGGEYELIEHSDFHGVDDIVVEMHPEHVGDALHSSALAKLLSDGFQIDTALSRNKVLHLYRPRAAT